VVDRAVMEVPITLHRPATRPSRRLPSGTTRSESPSPAAAVATPPYLRDPDAPIRPQDVGLPSSRISSPGADEKTTPRERYGIQDPDAPLRPVDVR
jgi:hypothetical protein